jgi:hypothetical protein
MFIGLFTFARSLNEHPLFIHTVPELIKGRSVIFLFCSLEEGGILTLNSKTLSRSGFSDVRSSLRMAMRASYRFREERRTLFAY